MHARAYSGAGTTARNLAHLNEGSQIRESHRSSEKDTRVQDAYSLRCTPQVHGAVRDSLVQAREMALVELNSATDNPLVFCGGRASDRQAGESFDGQGDIVSGGNFHGQPLAMAADQVAIAIATLSGPSQAAASSYFAPKVRSISGVANVQRMAVAIAAVTPTASRPARRCDRSRRRSRRNTLPVTPAAKSRHPSSGPTDGQPM